MAQFFGLATPADGSRVYFVTPMQQKGTNQPVWGKLFQVDASGLQLVLSRDENPKPPSPPPSYAVVTNPYDIVGINTSADGQVLAVQAYRSCFGGSGGTCLHLQLGTTTVITPSGQRNYEGLVRLSPNGKWGFAIGMLNFAAPFPPLSRINIATGEEVSLPGIFGNGSTGVGRIVADDGTAVLAGNGKVYVFSEGVQTSIDAPGAAGPVIDAAADLILFSICPNGYPDSSCTVNRVDKLRHGYTPMLQNARSPSLSDDGAQVLYLSMSDGVPEARIASVDSGDDRQITNEPSGIGSAILSGDGVTAYIVTQGGRLLKLSIADGATQELIPRTPFLTGLAAPLGAIAPCELVPLTGAGLSDTSTSALELPESLGGVQVTIQGKPARIQKVDPTTVTVLVPFDIDSTTGVSEVRLIADSPSPFETYPMLVSIAPFAPALLTVVPTAFNSNLLAAHQDWRAAVTDDNPARPGEIVHAYGVGLGFTLPSIPCWEVAPVTEQLRLFTPFRCFNANTENESVEVTFQGLAPGIAGYYQFDFRIPSLLNGNKFKMYCTTGSSFPSSIGGMVPVTPE